MTADLYDPLFNPNRPKTPSVETAAPVNAPINPMNGKPMLRAVAGGFGQAEIPVWIDPETKICVPVLK